MLKIIFLDIDGVLLPFPKTEEYDTLFPRCTVEALSYLRKETGAELVLSSTWRVRKDFIADIIDCLRGLQVENFDSFYDITDPNMHSERQWEIAKWLEDHRHEHDDIVWLALDDEDLLQGDANAKHRTAFEGHVIRTSSHIGLTMEDAKRGGELWKKQMP